MDMEIWISSGYAVCDVIVEPNVKNGAWRCVAWETLAVVWVVHVGWRHEFGFVVLAFTVGKSTYAARGHRQATLAARGRGQATPAARGRGQATPEAHGRGRATPLPRGYGSTNLAGHGRGGVVEPEVDVNVVETQNDEDLVDPVEDPVDPITEIIANAGTPTGFVDPVAAVQAFQTFMGLFAGNQAQVAPANAARTLTLDKGNTFDRFLKTNPPPFMGTDKPSDAEAWLLQMEKIFDVLGCSEAQKVSFGAYKLQGGAEHWWRSAKQHYKDKQDELVWRNFKKDFEEKYIPPAVKDKMRTEFLALRQDNMSVAEYQQKFDELSRFAGVLVEKETNKVWYFQRGLRADIHGRVSLLDTETLLKLVTRALTAESDLAEERRVTENQYKRFRSGQSSGSGLPAKRVHTLTQTNESGRQALRPCPKCGQPHLAKYHCDGSLRVCYSCGQPGHVSTHCRAQGDGRNQIPQSQRQPVHGNGHNQQRQFNNQGNYRQQARNGVSFNTMDMEIWINSGYAVCDVIVEPNVKNGAWRCVAWETLAVVWVVHVGRNPVIADANTLIASHHRRQSSLTLVIADAFHHCLYCSLLIAASKEDILKCKKAIDDNVAKKKNKKKAAVAIREEVNIVHEGDESEEGDEIENVAVGSKKRPYVLGPMDRYTNINPNFSDTSGFKKTRQPNINDAIWKEKSHKVSQYLARWVYETSISFHAIDNDSFKRFVEVVGLFGPGYQPPSQYQLREPLLKEEEERTKTFLKKQEEEWALMGTCFLSSKEDSEASHTGVYIFDYVDKFIEDMGAQNVVQVATDNASNNMAMTDLLKIKRPNIPTQLTSCLKELIHTKKKNRLDATRLNNLVYVQFNVKLINNKRKGKDVLRTKEETNAQGWLVEGGDEEVDPVSGLKWEVIREATGADEVLQPRRKYWSTIAT
ncbi:hypothetical protein RHSIM_Rhsim01G0132500 [Rhododendron simsii]|uniref:CCHC-type domain-containing protein n=1 Tax=Rhododendron simsii TaxID=118357 RepID=A0A834HET8_RHOSS|nr:hypothetical protein RHSIM_Rhsim01G0132500 [Rhododendron simsii]